jgi:hypothetical protein
MGFTKSKPRQSAVQVSAMRTAIIFFVKVLTSRPLHYRIKLPASSAGSSLSLPGVEPFTVIKHYSVKKPTRQRRTGQFGILK